MGKAIFKRGLDDNVLEITMEFFKTPIGKRIATKNDNTYQICIRDNYINVYWKGCSILKYSPLKEKKYLIHHKYVDSIASKSYHQKNPYIELQDDGVNVNDLVLEFNNKWKFSRLLNKPEILKDHAKGEKKELARYLEESRKGEFILLDLEVAFTRMRDPEEMKEGKKRNSVAHRIDMACIYLNGGKPELRLIEVKLNTDPRLKSDQDIKDKNPEVLRQMNYYSNFIKNEREYIVKSYQVIAKNYCKFINEGLISETYFPRLNGKSAQKILIAFYEKPVIDNKPHLLIIGDNKNLKKGRNSQNHWVKLKELFNDYVDTWPKKSL